MRQHCTATLLFFLLTAATWAAPVSRQQAMQVANDFFSEKGSRLSGLTVRKVRSSAATPDDAYYYIFNAEQGKGFVVVSGDDRTDAILGYADSGEVNEETMPANMRAWLQTYADQMKWMDQHGYQPTRDKAGRASRVPKKAIAPLLSSLWNQDEPYNLLCPKYNGELTATGCVATAMSQVMYYHKVPAKTKKTIPAYTTDTRKISVSSIPVTTLNWASMKDTYSKSTSLSNTSNKAVATLMKCVGAAMQMDYDIAENGGSGAYTYMAPEILNTYFGYDKDIKFANRNEYSYNAWVNLIYDELSRGPVLYSGQSLGGGHAFVCDGYAEDDYFHINWGWGGSSNGYFKLSVLSPENQGIGGSSTNDGYSFEQGAMVNVIPVDDGIDDNQNGPLTTQSLYVSENEISRTSSNANFTVTTYQELRNMTGSTINVDYAFGLYKDNELQSILSPGNDFLDNTWGWTSLETTVNFGKGLPDGDYRLVPVSRYAGTGSYAPNVGSEFHYIDVTINGNRLVMNDVDAYHMTADVSLVGGAVVDKSTIVKATLTNDYINPYSGDLFLYRQTGSGEQAEYSLLAAMQVERLAPEETKEFLFVFNPSETGSHQLLVVDKRGQIAGSATINVRANASTIGSLAFQSISITSPEAPYGIYGTSIRGSVTVKNNSSYEVSNRGLSARLAKWYHDGSNSGIYVATKNVDISVAKNSTATFDFEFDNLELATQYEKYDYTIILCNTDGTVIDDGYAYNFLCYPGVTTFMADGTKKTVAPTSTVTLANNVLAVDISGVTGVSKITPNSNPNTLYYVSADNVPAGLSGKNVVKDGVAETLTLTEGYSFFAPIGFTAEKATYTRQFSKGINGTDGWSTIILPFSVNTISQNSRQLAAERNYWIRQMTDDSMDKVNFGEATQIEANTPYLMAVTGSEWGESKNLTGKDITFSATNAVISESRYTSVTGDCFKFVGTTRAATISNAYVLNDAGNSFDKKASGTTEPFSAYITARENTNISSLPINVDIQPDNDDAEDLITSPVTPPEGLQTEEYTFSAAFYDFNEEKEIKTVSRKIQIGFDGDDVYINGISYYLAKNSWIKGKMNAEKTSVSFPSPQFYGTYVINTKNYDMYFIANIYDKDAEINEYPTTIEIPFDKTTGEFTVPSTLYILEGSEPVNDWKCYAYYYGISIAKGSPTPIEAPAGLAVDEYTVTARNYKDDADVTGTVFIGFDGSDIYVRGLAQWLPNAWVKGTFDGTTAILPAGQYLGNAQNYDMYLNSIRSSNVVLIFDAQKNSFTAENEFFLIDNSDYYFDSYRNAVFVKNGTDTAITSVDSNTAPKVYTDLQGRRVISPKKGSLYIKDGKKVLMR